MLNFPPCFLQDAPLPIPPTPRPVVKERLLSDFADRNVVPRLRSPFSSSLSVFFSNSFPDPQQASALTFGAGHLSVEPPLELFYFTPPEFPRFCAPSPPDDHPEGKARFEDLPLTIRPSRFKRTVAKPPPCPYYAMCPPGPPPPQFMQSGELSVRPAVSTLAPPPGSPAETIPRKFA